MTKEDDRFRRVYKQGVVSVIEIWIDKQTGVNYLWREDGYAGGITPLLDENGKPVITPPHMIDRR